MKFYHVYSSDIYAEEEKHVGMVWAYSRDEAYAKACGLFATPNRPYIYVECFHRCGMEV